MHGALWRTCRSGPPATSRYGTGAPPWRRHRSQAPSRGPSSRRPSRCAVMAPRTLSARQVQSVRPPALLARPHPAQPRALQTQMVPGRPRPSSSFSSSSPSQQAAAPAPSWPGTGGGAAMSPISPADTDEASSASNPSSQSAASSSSAGPDSGDASVSPPLSLWGRRRRPRRSSPALS